MVKQRLAQAALCAMISIPAAHAQFGRNAGDWMTTGSDAQRSRWIRSDQKISPNNLPNPDFKFLWKVNVGNAARGPLTSAMVLERYIGYRGFRSLAFVGSGTKDLYAVDTDLSRVEWHKPMGSAPAQGCAAPMMAIARPTSAALPSQTGGGGRGRGGFAKSGVGEPNQGAVTLKVADSAAFRRPPMLPTSPSAVSPGAIGPGVPGYAALPGLFGGRVPMMLYSVTGDGMLHGMYVSNGEEPKPPVKFLPGAASTQGLIVSDGVAYAAVPQSCGSVSAGIWAIDIASNDVSSWEAKGGVAGSAGPAIGPDGTVYVTTLGGELAALEPKTLKRKGVYNAGGPFATSPVLFAYKDRMLVAAAAQDGQIHLLDSTVFNGTSQPTALLKSPASTDGAPEGGALAVWQDRGGTHWLLEAAGSGSKGVVTAWKLVDQNGSLSLERGWASRSLAGPQLPIIINGVIFTASSSSPAVVYALDGTTGKELWNSGHAISGTLASAGLSGGGSQIYAGTTDGTLYAFGFFIDIEHQ